MRHLVALTLVTIVAGNGCPAAGTPIEPKGPGQIDDPAETAHADDGAPAATAAAGVAPRFTPPDQVKPERRVFAYVDGQRRVMDIDEARSVGLTVVDLSDDWVPYLFWSQTPGEDDYKENDYVDAYIRLANDEIDVNGASLRRGRRNYLEVYGIPPTLSVLRRRFLEDEKKSCYADLDYQLFSEYHGPVRIVDPRGSKRLDRRYHKARAAYRAALRAARVRTLEALLEKPAHAKVARRYQRYRWQRQAIRQMQKRVACEGLFKGRPRYKPGEINWTVRNALRRFEKKHNVYGWGMIFQKTADALGRTARQNNHESLKRLITERVISAAGILEDGTAGRRGRFVGVDGAQTKVRDLVSEFAEAAITQMGLTDADKALAFITEHSEEDFKRMLVAVKLPPVPEYYSDQMDLSVVINRGDVWYDLPFNDKGKRVAQPRQRLPTMTLYLTYREQKFALVRWRTTIGGWNAEMRDGQEYYKYKISDVGPRVWKNIVAGPGLGAAEEDAAAGHGQVRRRPARRLPEHLRPRLRVGLRTGGRATRDRERARQSDPHPRQRQLHEHPQPLLPRLSPAVQLPRGAPLLVCLAPPEVQTRRTDAARLSTPLRAQGRGVSDQPPYPRLLLRADPADTGQRPQGARAGHAPGALRGVRQEARQGLPGGPPRPEGPPSPEHDDGPAPDAVAIDQSRTGQAQGRPPPRKKGGVIRGGGLRRGKGRRLLVLPQRHFHVVCFGPAAERPFVGVVDSGCPALDRKRPALLPRRTPSQGEAPHACWL